MWNDSTHSKDYVSDFRLKSPTDIPTDHWIRKMIDGGKTDDPEFKRLLEIWGRERFERVWKACRDKTPKETE